MFKFQIRNFFRENGFEETYEDCFEKDKVAFVIDGKYLLCCLKNEKGYKIQKKTFCRKIRIIARHDNGTVIA